MEGYQLTERQQNILASIIQEYIETSEPIGSEDLVNKHEFVFSPATMRNEMAELTRKGFLQKDHVSAGRVPTPQGFRYYLKNMLQEKDLPVVNEVAIKQRLWDQKHDIGHLLREASQALAEELQNLTIIITDDGRVYSAGTAHILRHPEFYDIDLTRTVLHLIDQHDIIRAILGQLSPDAEFGVMLGDEIGLQSLNQCGIVATRINLPNNHHGFVTVIGPYRLDYPSVIPTVRYIQHTINDMLRSW
jgi:heat-inducible transcriptional repressor